MDLEESINNQVSLFYSMVKELKAGTISYQDVTRRERVHPPIKKVCHRLGVQKLTEIRSDEDIYRVLREIVSEKVHRRIEAGIVKLTADGSVVDLDYSLYDSSRETSPAVRSERMFFGSTPEASPHSTQGSHPASPVGGLPPPLLCDTLDLLKIVLSVRAEGGLVRKALGVPNSATTLPTGPNSATAGLEPLPIDYIVAVVKHICAILGCVRLDQSISHEQTISAFDVYVKQSRSVTPQNTKTIHKKFFAEHHIDKTASKSSISSESLEVDNNNGGVAPQGSDDSEVVPQKDREGDNEHSGLDTTFALALDTQNIVSTGADSARTDPADERSPSYRFPTTGVPDRQLNSALSPILESGKSQDGGSNAPSEISTPSGAANKKKIAVPLLNLPAVSATSTHDNDATIQFPQGNITDTSSSFAAAVAARIEAMNPEPKFSSFSVDDDGDVDTERMQRERVEDERRYKEYRAQLRRPHRKVDDLHLEFWQLTHRLFLAVCNPFRRCVECLNIIEDMLVLVDAQSELMSPGLGIALDVVVQRAMYELSDKVTRQAKYPPDVSGNHGPIEVDEGPQPQCSIRDIELCISIMSNKVTPLCCKVLCEFIERSGVSPPANITTSWGEKVSTLTRQLQELIAWSSSNSQACIPATFSCNQHALDIASPSALSSARDQLDNFPQSNTHSARQSLVSDLNPQAVLHVDDAMRMVAKEISGISGASLPIDVVQSVQLSLHRLIHEQISPDCDLTLCGSAVLGIMDSVETTLSSSSFHNSNNFSQQNMIGPRFEIDFVALIPPYKNNFHGMTKEEQSVEIESFQKKLKVLREYERVLEVDSTLDAALKHLRACVKDFYSLSSDFSARLTPMANLPFAAPCPAPVATAGGFQALDELGTSKWELQYFAHIESGKNQHALHHGLNNFAQQWDGKTSGSTTARSAVSAQYGTPPHSSRTGGYSARSVGSRGIFSEGIDDTTSLNTARSAALSTNDAAAVVASASTAVITSAIAAASAAPCNMERKLFHISQASQDVERIKQAGDRLVDAVVSAKKMTAQRSNLIPLLAKKLDNLQDQLDGYEKDRLVCIRKHMKVLEKGLRDSGFGFVKSVAGKTRFLHIKFAHGSPPSQTNSAPNSGRKPSNPFSFVQSSPIVFSHHQFGQPNVTCNLILCNSLPAQMTDLMEAYISLDRSGRVRDFLYVLKLFIKAHRICDISHGFLSVTAWYVMALHVLLRFDFVPNIHDIEMSNGEYVESKRLQRPRSFDRDTLARLKMRQLTEAQQIKLSHTSTLCLLDLFFRYYAESLDIFSCIITIRGRGETIPKWSWLPRLAVLWRISIEDPFDGVGTQRPHDLGSTLTRPGQLTTFKAIRRAVYGIRSIINSGTDSCRTNIRKFFSRTELVHLARRSDYMGATISDPPEWKHHILRSILDTSVYQNRSLSLYHAYQHLEVELMKEFESRTESRLFGSSYNSGGQSKAFVQSDNQPMRQGQMTPHYMQVQQGKQYSTNQHNHPHHQNYYPTQRPGSGTYQHTGVSAAHNSQSSYQQRAFNNNRIGGNDMKYTLPSQGSGRAHDRNRYEDYHNTQFQEQQYGGPQHYEGSQLRSNYQQQSFSRSQSHQQQQQMQQYNNLNQYPEHGRSNTRNYTQAPGMMGMEPSGNMGIYRNSAEQTGNGQNLHIGSHDSHSVRSHSNHVMQPSDFTYRPGSGSFRSTGNSTDAGMGSIDFGSASQSGKYDSFAEHHNWGGLSSTENTPRLPHPSNQTSAAMYESTCPPFPNTMNGLNQVTLSTSMSNQEVHHPPRDRNLNRPLPALPSNVHTAVDTMTGAMQLATANFDRNVSSNESSPNRQRIDTDLEVDGMIFNALSSQQYQQQHVQTLNPYGGYANDNFLAPSSNNSPDRRLGVEDNQYNWNSENNSLLFGLLGSSSSAMNPTANEISLSLSNLNVVEGDSNGLIAAPAAEYGQLPPGLHSQQIQGGSSNAFDFGHAPPGLQNQQFQGTMSDDKDIYSPEHRFF